MNWETCAAVERHLDNSIRSFLRHALRRQIESLREYRTRLIADVVTGPVDVREATKKLSDETDDEVETLSEA